MDSFLLYPARSPLLNLLVGGFLIKTSKRVKAKYMHTRAWLAELFMEDKTAIKMCKPILPLKLSGKKLTRKKIKVKSYKDKG